MQKSAKKVLPAKQKARHGRSTKPNPSTPELLYYGVHVCEALEARRRDAIVRVYCTEDTMGKFSRLLKWCAANRKAYHLVKAEELERITGSVHHEGVAILAKCPPPSSMEELLKRLDEKVEPLVFLDSVQNPHNIGTIMRVMASFGWPYLIGGPGLPSLTAAAARMSEGGSEWVTMFSCQDVKKLCSELKKRSYRVLGTSSHAKKSLYQQKLPLNSVIVMGSEVNGVSPLLQSLVDDEIIIPATGKVESLNVAVACGLLLGEYTRQHGLSSSVSN